MGALPRGQRAVPSLKQDGQWFRPELATGHPCVPIRSSGTRAAVL